MGKIHISKSKLLSLFFGFVFLFSIFIPLAPIITSSASAATPDKLTQLAKSWSAMTYIKRYGFSSNTTLTVNYMNEMVVPNYLNIRVGESGLGPGAAEADNEATIGFLLSPGDAYLYADATDGVAESKDNRKAIFSPIIQNMVSPTDGQPLDGTRFVEALGYTKNGDGNYTGGSTGSAGLEKILFDKRFWPEGLDVGNFSNGVAPGWLQYAVAMNILTNRSTKNPCKAATDPYSLPGNSIGSADGNTTSALWLVKPGQSTAAQYIVNSGDASAKTYIGNGIGIGEGGQSGDITCGKIREVLVNQQYAKQYAEALAISDTTVAPPPPGGGLVEEIDECAKLGESSLRWILCPVYEMLANVSDGLVSKLQDFLSYGAVYMDESQAGGNAMKAAWSSFRTIGLALLVIGALIMIVSQAFGFSFLDAYTVKKVLPRLLIAIIGITLSWPILKFTIGFFDDIGFWVRDIILLPFETAMRESFLPTVSPPSGIGTATNVVTTAIFGTVGTGAAVAFLGIGGIMSLIGTVTLMILIGMIVLGIRTAVISLCIIIAPLAIAAYVLPGTKKMWDFWQNTLLTALMMFPIVMAFIAAGEAMGSVITMNGDNGWLAALVRFAPFFLLPFAFKLAGGLMKTIFSIADDKNRGAFDRLKKGRQNRIATNAHKMAEGNRFSSSNAFGRGLNRSTAGAANLKNAGMNPMKMKERMASAGGQAELAHAAEAMEKNADFAAIKNVDEMLRAAKDGRSESDVRRILQSEGYSGDRLNEATARVMRAKKSMSPGSMKIAATMGLAATGTGYKDVGQMMAAISDATDGKDNMALDLMGRMRGIASQARRMDLGGAGFATMMAEQQNANKAFRNGLNAAAAVDNDKIYNDVAINGGDANTLIRGNRKEGIQNLSRGTAGAINRLQAKQRAGGLSMEEAQHLGALHAVRDNLKQSVDTYGASGQTSTILKRDLHDATAYSTEEFRQVVAEDRARPYMQDADGNILTNEKGKPIAVADVKAAAAKAGADPEFIYTSGTQEPSVTAYNANRQRPSYNPADPNNLPPE